MDAGLPPGWKDALALNRRRPPELYQQGDQPDEGPHSQEIQVMLGELRLSAVFCIDAVPTIGFVVGDDMSPNDLDLLHHRLWNQGLLGLLLVISDEQVRVISLARRPAIGESDTSRLVEVLSLVADSIKLRDLVEQIEAGRYWIDHEEHFPTDERVDAVLLDNIKATIGKLATTLGVGTAQALVMQTMFVAYLEDRRVIGTDRFKKASAGRFGNFAALLAAKDVEAFYELFIALNGVLGGDIFRAPGVLGADRKTPGIGPLDDEPSSPIEPSHLHWLAVFRAGREEMHTGQGRLFGYDFRFIPIGLISAVYDRFLAEDERRSAEGAFYTPMFLADMVIDQVWPEMSPMQRAEGRVLDPACGSGIFLVRMFQRLVADWSRKHADQPAPWAVLVATARRLHGTDINAAAVRIAVFSIYIAMLERMNPPDLAQLMRVGSILPILHGETLRRQDFFLSEPVPADIIIGNPPWRGRPGDEDAPRVVPKEDGYPLPMPEKEIAWLFVWESFRRLAPDGVLVLLLPAMGFLHNTKPDAIAARQRLLATKRIVRVVNLSDLCFQLFDGASRPTALMVARPLGPGEAGYMFDYWCPKADLNLRQRRGLALSRADHMRLRSDVGTRDPKVFKRRLWTRGPDERLLQFIGTIPRLAALVVQYKNCPQGTTRDTRWVIGQGFQPVVVEKIGTPGYSCRREPSVTRHPFLDARRSFSTLALPTISSPLWPNDLVRRGGYVDGFQGPHILIPQGVERADGRVRAAFTEQSLVFQHSLQAIAFPEAAIPLAKILTAVLNSRLAAWFYFHESANMGTDRAKVLQSELLDLPFAAPDAMPDPERANGAASALIRIVDEAVRSADAVLRSERRITAELDEQVYEYFGLDEADRALIDDAYEHLIPAMQPRASAPVKSIWMPATYGIRKAYADTLRAALANWTDRPVEASLAALSAEVGIVRVRLVDGPAGAYTEDYRIATGHLLDRLAMAVTLPAAGNFQIMPDLRIALDDSLYLVKPLQRRSWLRSSALADAEDIAAELQGAAFSLHQLHQTGKGGADDRW